MRLELVAEAHPRLAADRATLEARSKALADAQVTLRREIAALAAP